MSTLNILPNDTPTHPTKCGGVFYRINREAYTGNAGDINFKIRFRPQTKMSCPGCPMCWYITSDDINVLYEQFINGDVLLNHNEKHGTLFELKITNVSTCWETGYIDDYDLKFIEVKCVKDNPS